MHDRCTNENAHQYPNYGGRGIRVCERWQKFENFLDDMGHRPSSRHSIDRWPNVNGNYEPSNCRWATWTQQANNKRNTVMVTYNGETLPASTWSRRLGGNRNMVAKRIKDGWSIERACTEPPKRQACEELLAGLKR